jgi:peptidoglycan hydrolase CwlO-like protein
MKNVRKILLLLFVIILAFSTVAGKSFSVVAQSPEEEKLQQLAEQIQEYEKEIEKLNNQKTTLSNQIAQYDAQIKLTGLKIAETEEKIQLLGGRIDQLEVSLTSLTSAFANRVVRTYKMAKLNEPFLMLVTSPNLSEAVASYHYLQKIQEADRDLLVRLENAQEQYKDQKVEQEDLQKQLEDQRAVLGTQKAVKANLLVQTQNNEKKYQQLLASARAEYEAIQAIVAGKGDETEVGKVSQGQRIASIIQGASCNSSGTHLHFIVKQGDSTHNPFNYLKSGIDYEDCSGSSCGSGDGDPFNPGGPWDWPIQPKIKFSQGYGATWAVLNTWVGRIYRFHNGIDISSGSSSEVIAVRAGTLYRGSYGGAGGCRLRYVRVDHDDSDLDTLYLHINY